MPADSERGRPPRPIEPRGPTSTAMPPTASAIQRKSTGRREPSTATTSGPANSIATTMPSGATEMAP